VYDIFSSSWPTFVPLSERLANGHTDKTTSGHDIQLNPDLIVALEKAPEVNEAQVTYISDYYFCS